MEIIKLREDFIKLGQALKAAGLVESGVDAAVGARMLVKLCAAALKSNKK